jgi:hypothetical protein
MVRSMVLTRGDQRSVVPIQTQDRTNAVATLEFVGEPANYVEYSGTTATRETSTTETSEIIITCDA